MASHSLAPSVWHSFLSLVGGLSESRTHRSILEPSSEDRQADRDLVSEVLWRNPEAFSSEMDVQLMMQMYSGQV